VAGSFCVTRVGSTSCPDFGMDYMNLIGKERKEFWLPVLQRERTEIDCMKGEETENLVFLFSPLHASG